MKLQKYQHVFFDLDRTLWDFERNSRTALVKLFREHELNTKLDADFDQFFEVYRLENHKLWENYKVGKVSKEKLRKARFDHTFRCFGYRNPKLALLFNNQYVNLSSKQKHLVNGAREILEFLYPNYELHIITNGFQEAQNAKLDACKIRKFFKQIVISDGLPFKKPQAGIFNHAMQLAGANPENSLMIGDDYEPDVLGAKAVGMDQVYFELQKVENNRAAYTIHSLEELRNIL